MADNTEIGTVRQVQTSDGLYDIEAPKLVEENSFKMAGLDVNTSTGSAIVGFNKNAAGTEGGQIEFNSKGNLAVESLTKHVNIEAKKGIQLKPTTNIIFDSSRRILADKGNEVHLEFSFDDYKDFTKGDAPEYEGHSGNDEPHAELKVEARNIDLRCFEHGGIALQPCGTDGDDFENKIKFESSRTAALDSQNPTYATEGGKGLEFGTFNNEHTSLFTKDYRFNKDGIVFAVTRGTPTTVDGKFDYPTQEDDFKDVIASNTRSCAWKYIVMAGSIIEYLSSHYELPYTTENLLAAFNAVCAPLPVVYDPGLDYNNQQ